jgi:hypothetical protein
MGYIVAGAAIFIAIPAIYKHYSRERKRNRVLRDLRERTVSKTGHN